MKPSLPQRAYNALADAYAARIDTKAHNAFYERPATLTLVPEVAETIVLDAGCGPGVYTEWLLNRGAKVVAFDANERMLFHARKRIGQRAELHLANMEEPLSFMDDNSVDGVLSALAITYVRDHKSLFSEFKRVLRPHGWLVVSTEHPFFSYGYFKVANYFITKKVSSVWKGFGKPVRVPSYYHSLGSICEALSENGFLIERVLEPKPKGPFRKEDSKEYQKLMRFPLFLCIKASKL